jgi:hypothetical protein
LKYSKSDIIGIPFFHLFYFDLGVLLGKKSNNQVTVTDSIPLFHERVMSGPLEIAFEMIESYIKESDVKIVGVYESSLSLNNET